MAGFRADYGLSLSQGYSKVGPESTASPADNSSSPSQGAATETRIRGQQPGADWEIDYTEIKPGTYRYNYLLVVIDTFSGWVEAYPTKTETVNAVTKKPLGDITPGMACLPCLGLTVDQPSSLR